MIDRTLLFTTVFIVGVSSICLPSDGATRAPAEPEPKMVREIFVPFEDLHVLLENQPRRVLLTREEYLRLREAAQVEEQVRPPRSAAILAANYDVTMEPGRAVIVGTLHIEVLADGIHALGLDIASVGLRRATLDGQDAPIGRSDDGRYELFVRDKGLHELRLELVAPLETTAAAQILHYRLPTPATTTLHLTVPGDVEIKAGTETIRRVVDQEAAVTRFELVPRRGDVSLVMTLNSRLLRQERVVIARSVLVDEVTQSYERLHATFSMAVLYKAVDAFQFELPDDFEVIHVQSPLLARWSVEQQDDRRILDIHLTEQTTETVVLSLAALRTHPRLEGWSLPRLRPLDVEGEVAVVGLLVEDRLKTHSIESTGLLSLDTVVLTHALPASVFQAEPGDPKVRPIVAGYAPQGGFQISAQFRRPEAEIAVVSNLLLTLADTGQNVRGGYTLRPEVEKRFHFDFTTPPKWHVSGVTDAANQPLPIERFERPDGGLRIHVRLPQGVLPGQEYQLYFQAAHEPVGWLESWESIETTFPSFRALDVTIETGAIAVAVRDDLMVRPDRIENIQSLDEHEKDEYGLKGVPTALAYRFGDQEYQAAFTVERIRPRMTARTYSFFTVTPDFLVAHYEINYDVEEAGTRELALVLPDSTPAALSIRGLGDIRLKEYNSRNDDGQRRWSVLLAERQRGTIRLAVDFQQPLTEQEPKDLVLPVVRADGVSYQSGLVAVEGSAELTVEIKTDLRKADVGELIDAEYQTGRRLLGAFRFAGDRSTVSINVFRYAGYQLPPVIVQRAELVTMLDARGLSQTAGRFALRTKAQFLEVRLPGDSVLWSMELDGKPAKPQREGDALLISLPATMETSLRDLRIVYEVPVNGIVLTRSVDVLAPTLLLRASAGQTGVEIPMADLSWQLHLPNGFRAVSTGGTVVTDDVPASEPALSSLAAFLYRIGGGVKWFYDGYGCRGLVRARELAKRSDYEEWGSSVAESFKRFDGDDESRSYLESGRDAYGIGGDRLPQAEGMTGRLAAEEGDKKRLRTADPRPMSPGPRRAEAPDRKPGAAGAWAMEGVRSLKIDLQQQGQRIAFRSLGGDPRLQVTMTREDRFDGLALTLAGAVFLAGLVGLRWPLRKRLVFIFTVAALATLLPLVTGSAVLIQLLNPAFYAACALLPVYPVIALVRWVMARVRPQMPASQALATSVLMLVLFAVPASVVRAEDGNDGVIDQIINRLQPPGPVDIPADAIILPYDADSETGIQDADQLLLPYDQYVRLWNQAHPDEKLQVTSPPADYALGGGVYNATLRGDEYLAIEATLTIDVYSDKPVIVPLALEGGVLARADLDGKPARLSVATAATPTRGKVEAAKEAHRPESAEAMILLHVADTGRHRLEFAVRMKLQRPGGWRVAAGRLPVVPAAALNLTVPQPQTEIRIGHVVDKRSYLTAKADEVIATVLPGDGGIDIRWRPKVTEGVIDRSLTAQSTAVLDVQEEGLRLEWTTNLAFRRGEQEFFTFQLPSDYLVLKVMGENVRGWETRKDDGGERIEVSMLKPARDKESIALHLWRQGSVGQAELATFAAPVVTVPDAALQQGIMVIRRSPLLNVQTLETAGVVRADLPAKVGSDRPQESPLGIRAYQAYQFATTPFVIRLEAKPVRGRTSATVQTILRIAQRERTLETRVNLDAQERPLYRASILLPEDLKLDRVSAPGAFEWAVNDTEQGSVLSVYLAQGRSGQVPIVLTGTLGESGAVEEIPLPHLAVLDVDHQSGDIVVQVDPAYDIRVQDLAKCESILMKHVRHWLESSQHKLARIAIHYEGSDYSGVLKLSLRKPSVRCDTISNVRITERSIEETILLDFWIHQAGVREVVFLLPPQLANARISVPQLRQKTIEPASADPDAPLRVRLELQDAVMGQLRVLVENDRLLTPDIHVVPVPAVETGRITRRYVLLESAGRDELVVEKTEGLDELSRSQREWSVLASILGSGITRAYIVQTDVEQPVLTYRTRDRAIVETVGARIGLAETLMVVDANSTYRAVQSHRVHNTTEQYLEIQMPDNATLWTVLVDREPVKPTMVPDPAKPRNVRIPLIKTAQGDLPYEVLLTYGGQLPEFSVTSAMTFPLIRTVNINIAMSQVRLYLPDRYKWFDFGGTMRQADDEADLAAGYVSYQTRVAERLTQTMQTDDDYAKVRAAENLKVLQDEVTAFQTFNRELAESLEVQEELRTNSRLIGQAGQKIKELEEQFGRMTATDNRGGLNEYFVNQRNDRSSNVVLFLSPNFGGVSDEGQGQTLYSSTTQPAADGQFDADWFSRNKLTTTQVGHEVATQLSDAKDAAGPGSGIQVITGDIPAQIAPGAETSTLTLGGANVVFDLDLQQRDRVQAPSFAQGEDLAKIQKQLAKLKEEAGGEREGGRGRSQREALSRYQQAVRSGIAQKRSMSYGYAVPQGAVGEAEPAAKPDDAPSALPADLGPYVPSRRGEVMPGNQPRIAGVAPVQPVMLTGLASLSVNIPVRGQVFFFTTPRGETVITARAASKRFMGNAWYLLVVVVVLAVIVAVYRLFRQEGFATQNARAMALAAIIAGLVCVVIGFLPILGVIVALVGLAARIQMRLAGRFLVWHQ